MYGSYHPILVANKLNEAEKETYDVAGPICESGDLLAKDADYCPRSKKATCWRF